MILVTRLDGTTMIVSSDQIAWIEYNPDTVIALNNGEKLIVRESPETLVERVKAFKRAAGLPGGQLDPRPLSIAQTTGDAP
jgi:uncharacterized protein YlzI (FlbEa/FlbD family)